MRFKHLTLGFFIIFAFIGSSWAQKPQVCQITSDTFPPAVNGGGTHPFTASCPNPVWSVSGPGSIDPSTGVYQAPATVWAQDVSRGWQLLPNDTISLLLWRQLRAVPKYQFPNFAAAQREYAERMVARPSCAALSAPVHG